MTFSSCDVFGLPVPLLASKHRIYSGIALEDVVGFVCMLNQPCRTALSEDFALWRPGNGPAKKG